jgi:hypothetical protein
LDIQKEIAMSASTLLAVVVLVALFAAFAGTLAWAQQHVRRESPMPADVFGRKRRPF